MKDVDCKCYIGMQVTEEQKKQIQEAAKEANLTVSGYLRHLTFENENIAPKEKRSFDSLLTLTEFAQMIKVSRTTARKIVRSGEVDHITLPNKRYRISRASAEAFKLRTKWVYDSDDSRQGKLLTLTEAARFLNLSQQTVSRHVRSGRIKAYLLGKRYRFKAEDLEAFLQSAKV